MQYCVTTETLSTQQSDCLVVAIYQGGALSPSAKALDEISDGHITRVVETGDIAGKAGDIQLLHHINGVPSPRIMLLGLGNEASISENDFNTATTAMAKQLNEIGATSAVIALSEVKVGNRAASWNIRQTAQNTETALYTYTQTKNDIKVPSAPLDVIIFLTDDEAAATTAMKQGQAIGRGMNLARQLGNLPGNICTPSYLADEALKLDHEFDTITTTVLEEEDMAELGMGSLLSVSRGSRQPAKLITLEYNGFGDSKPVVLVGKGLTFDAGGISLKPSQGMDEMKYDMCGSASVLGTLRAVAELCLPINVVGVIPSSENLPDGEANKPGDIVTSMAGKTIEILNTDAEGRLLLCDALTYSARFNPDTVIDIATLTGAIIVALGNVNTGLMANDQTLADELKAAGQDSFDRVWQMPLMDEYQKQLDSNFADIANVGGKEAGSVTAACFLARFTEGYKWAHLDIAGTAWNSGKEKGATGRPVPLLVQYLLNKIAV